MDGDDNGPMDKGTTQQVLMGTLSALEALFPDAGILLVVWPHQGDPPAPASLVSNAQKEEIETVMEDALRRLRRLILPETLQ